MYTKLFGLKPSFLAAALLALNGVNVAAAAQVNTSTTSKKMHNVSAQPMLLAQAIFCSDNIRYVNFSGRAAWTGVNIRSGPSLNASILQRAQPNQLLYFDGWKYSDSVNDLWYNQPDARWYKLSGQNAWVASAVIWGNAPGSTPTCQTPPSSTSQNPVIDKNYFSNLLSWNDTQWENTINSANALNAINNNSNSDIGRIYRDLTNDLFGRNFPITGAYVSDDYRNATRPFCSICGFHGGIDIGTPVGIAVKSMVNGTVVLAQRNINGSANGSGILTIKDASGKNYIYMHLSRINVSNGQQVRKGDIVGLTGSTGGVAPHLHYEVARPGFPWGCLQIPAAITKQNFRDRTHNPLKDYWEMRRRG